MPLPPLNYVDLFDRFWPEYWVPGLADENEISVGGINERLAAVRANQRSLRAALGAIAARGVAADFLRDLLLPFWEVAAHRRFSFTAAERAAHTFREGFDSAGEGLAFDHPMVVLPLNDVGGALLSDECEVQVFADGLLLPRSTWAVREVQGGAMVYVDRTRIPLDAPVDVVAMRRFNVMRPEGRFTWRAPSAATVNDPLSFDYPATHYGRLYSARYLRLFSKAPGAAFYRPVDRSLWAARVAEDGDTVGFTVLNALQDEAFMVVDLTESWEFYYEGPIPASSPLLTRIPLTVDVFGTPAPAPVAHDRDVQVFVDGRLLQLGVDYDLTFNDPVGPSILFLSLSPRPQGSHILVRSGAPYEPEDAIEYRADVLPEPHGVVAVPYEGRPLRLLPRLGLLYSDGRLANVSENDTIAGNVGLHLPARSMYAAEYRLRFVLPDGTRELVRDISTAKGPVEQIIEVVASDPARAVADFLANYIATAHPPLIGTVAPEPGTEDTVPGGYEWVSDALPLLIAVNAPVIVGNRPGDEAMGVYETEEALAPYVDPVTGALVVDCREGSAPVDVALDCR